MRRWSRLVLVLMTAVAAFVVGAAGAGLLTHSNLLPVRLQSALAAPRPPENLLLPAPATPARNEGETQVAATVLGQAAAVRLALPATQSARTEPTTLSTALVQPIATLAAPGLLEVTPTPAVASVNPSAALATRISLEGLRHEWQTWNNCGPATLSTLLSYYGSPLTQADIGSVLRQSPDDKNVSPDELLAFAQQQGMAATLRVNGSSALMRALLASGYPVLIETWLEEQPNDGMGHYRLLTGFDDDLQGWIAYDSYVSTGLIGGGGEKGGSDEPYAGIFLSYAETDALWKVFNRTYLLAYPPAAEAEVAAILAANGGEGAAVESMWAAAEGTSRNEIAADGADAFAWFNLGSSLWNQGRADEAVAAFDQARTFGLPWRMLWYQFAPFAAYHAVGRYQDVLDLADATLANVDSVEEVFYWKGRALEALGNADGARAAFERALALAPSFAEARTALGQ